jgi:tripartite-type tricarboxylate transporter receptor subunit TctC
MKITGAARFLLFLSTAALQCVPAALQAQEYPNRPIRMILPFANDILARPLAHALAESLGQQVVVDPRTGGQTIIGTELAARSPGDGYTILMITNSHTINETLRPDRPYNLLRDFVPITQLAKLEMILAVHAAVPATSIAELIALAKSQPGKLNYASSAPVYQLPMELFKSMAGVNIVHVPYKSSANARIDVLGGQVQVILDGVNSLLPHVKTNKVRALAVTGAKRSEALPDVPTVSETGLAGYDGDGWMGYLAPAGTPAAITKRLQSEIASFLARPEVRVAYKAQGAVPVGSTPEEFGAFLKRDIDKWAKVVEASGAKAQ